MANKDTTLPLGGGPDGSAPVFIKKGTRVVWEPYGMHRREDYFGPDAESFRPERWETRRTHFEYLPFNAGPRICLGQNFAMTEASYVLVRMAQEFRTLRNRDARPFSEAYTISLANSNGVNVEFGR